MNTKPIATKKRWKKSEIDYLNENINKIPFEQLCKFLGRSQMAVRLFLHRKRSTTKNCVKNNVLLQILSNKFTDPNLFMPNREFYRAVLIGQRRYWQIYKGIVPMNDNECHRICDFFNIDYTEYLNMIQTDLFD